MEKNTCCYNSSKFVKIGVILIILLSIFMVYAYSNGQIKDEQDLRSKTLKSLENTRTYRFDLNSNLSLLNENLQVIKAEGQVDLVNKSTVQSIIYSNRSLEVVVINDQAYYRENEGAWKVQKLDNTEMSDDQLSEQRSILIYAQNMKMSKVEGGWVLEIVPEREDILKQMRNMRFDTSESELKDFVTRYWIEEDTFRIRSIGTYAEVETNLRGMMTLVKLESIIHLDNYDEYIEIKAPI